RRPPRSPRPRRLEPGPSSPSRPWQPTPVALVGPAPVPTSEVATARQRLDAELVRRGLVSSREQARAHIDAGQVTVGGAPATKPARLVAPDEPVVLLAPPPPFVSRAGEKLAAALDRFTVDVTGARALDAGASTGGFTDCLLQRGAAHVVA